ncbi:MAG: hypothetical protein U5L96_02205 [Owenweeksia sp.]|nr:hypothetical protein [Owenweeksia sp.]
MNENLSLDTVTQINSSKEGRFKLLDQQGHYAYFGIGEDFFRFNEITQSIERINVDFLNGLNFKAYNVFTTEDAFFIVEDYIYRLAHNDSTFSKGLEANDSLYPRLVLYPKINVNEGVQVTFYGADDSLHYSGILQGDSAIIQIRSLPAWPDTSFKVNLVPGASYAQISHSPKGADFQSFIITSRGKWRTSGEYVGQVRWYYFDTLSNSFSITQDTHNAHYVETNPANFKLKKGTVAFSMYKNKGLELVKLHRDSLELLRDNFTGMASGIGKNDQSLVLDGELYYMATHPYYGYSLHRTDGSREGTGVIASLDKKFKSSKLVSIGSKVYLAGSTLGLPAKVFEVAKDSPFLEDKYSQNSTEHWNQSIYSNLYYQSASGRARYNRPKMKTKDGLILCSTGSHSQGNRFFPEEELKSPYHTRTGNSWPLTKTYALYDTSGNLLLPGYVRGYSGHRGVSNYFRYYHTHLFPS